MRLTNYIRSAFVRAAMDDVPTVDYAEKIRVAVQADAIAQLPPKIKAIAQDSTLSHWLTHRFQYYDNFSVSVIAESSGYKPSEKVAEQLKVWNDEHKSQRAKHKALRDKLEGIANSAKTRKELAAMLPEFEKYLPADEAAACRTLPAIANVVSDFVQAGWPKGKKPDPAPVAKKAAKRSVRRA